MISRQTVNTIINDAEKEFRIAWDSLSKLKSLKPNNFSAEEILNIQPPLAKGIYSLSKTYHDLAAEKKLYIARKKELSDKWFRNRLRTIDLYQDAIKTTIAIGKSIGDAFCWFFYNKERNLLFEHGKHPNIAIPPIGIGGKGELALAQNAQYIDGHILLHHGITNILRLGDISIISLSDFKIVAIAEIKSRPEGAKFLQISMSLISIDKEKLKKFSNILANQSPPDTKKFDPFPAYIRDKINRQARQIGKILNRPTANQTEKLNFKSNKKDLESIFENREFVPASIHKIGKSQVIFRTDLHQNDLAHRIIDGHRSSVIKKFHGLEKATLEITVSDKSKNSLYIGEPYNPTSETKTNPSLVPLFWWPIDVFIPKALIFHKTILFSIFNVGPFLQDLENLGFDIKVDTHTYKATKVFSNGTKISLENISYYFDFIVLGFMKEESLIKIFSRMLKAYEKGEIAENTKIELEIIQHI